MHLLCDYTRVEDPTRETMEMLMDGEVIEWVTRLVTPMTIIMAKDIVEAFLAIHWPDLLSRPYLCIFLLFGVIGSIDHAFIAYAFVHLLVLPSLP